MFSETVYPSWLTETSDLAWLSPDSVKPGPSPSISHGINFFDRKNSSVGFHLMVHLHPAAGNRLLRDSRLVRLSSSSEIIGQIHVLLGSSSYLPFK